MCNDSSIFTQKCSHLYNRLESSHFFMLDFFPALSCSVPTSTKPAAALRVHDWRK